MTPGGRAAFHTLGCKLNFSETSTIARDLAEAGYARVGIDEAPDVVVINTCSVTEQADAKCRNAVRRALTSNPEAFVVVIGCYAQLKPSEIASIEGVDVVLGAQEKFNILSHIASQKNETGTMTVGPIKEVRSFIPGFSSQDRTRTFLKVQDGCDYFCSFCTIPLARGRSRNASIADTLAVAHKAVESGAKEIVLTGVNIGDFGKSTDETFFDLVRALDEQVEVNRFRISSIEPNLLTSDIIEFVAQSEKFQPHFHIPLQSGSDAVLKSMRRRYRTALYSDRIREIREILPQASIGVDVITGFPNESEADFETTQSFLLNQPVSYLHVFTYSERAKTTAPRMSESVPVEIRKERTKILRGLSLKKQRQHYEQFLDTTRPILFEDAVEDGVRFGYSPEYVRIGVDAELVASNVIVDAKIEKIHAAGYASASPQLVQ
ncbi:MAG: tRNA (N(6)-L-threonylcarbamoyladenosine(37)-C(2))-methylthiotransferase MtaB [Bacteroidetes bacterium]|nr:tRNA (N(6)-L-threonylcarbamoyladenosine(37)-C(2))-methylthiotransferase MtaB [Bacteroidota bacterium]MDA1335872.1 tRNA (N(6)-L-threonylcarbamoyladenosine(37)-C(2))-methylthiotransferase MtaB [Bacteroidota bacterium]